MTDVTIWHNPRCSKSRETLTLLEARGIAPRVVKYLEETPSAAEILQAAALAGQLHEITKELEERPE